MRKFLAILLILLFWLVFPLSFTLLSVKLVLLVPDTYKTVLLKEDAYDKTLNIFSDQVLQQLTRNEDLTLEKEDVNQLVKNTITPSWLQQNTEKIIDSVISLITSQISLSDFELTISTKELKQTFVTSFNKLIVEKTGIAEDEIGAEDLTEDIPNEFDLKSYILKTRQAQQYITLAQKWYLIFKQIIFYSFIAWAVLLILIALLLMYKIKVLVRWIGITLFIPGIICLPILLLTRFAFKPLFSMLVVSSLPTEILPDLIDLITSISFGVINKFVMVLLWPMLIAFILGLGLIILAGFLKGKPKK